MRLIAGLAMLLSALCLATGASAHATLVSTDPGDGSILALAPKSVQLRFNEAVTPTVVRVIDAAGTTRDDVTVRVAGNSIIVTLPDNLPRGTQVISYRVTSEDGHPVAGAMVFSIGAATGAVASESRAGSVNSLIWLARTGVYLGLLVGVGGAFFIFWIGRMPVGARLVSAALVAGLVSAVAALGLQGLDLLDLPPASLLTAAPWKAAAATSLFQSLLIAMLAMTAGIAALRSEGASRARVLSGFALVGVGLSLASSGHAATATPQWLTAPAVFLHGVGAAFWVGALAPLAAMAWRSAQPLLPALNRFSHAAILVVAMLVLTGLALAIVQLGSFGALIGSPYGIVLSIKLTLVAALLGLAALNRFRLTSALAINPQNTRPLRRSILAECVIACAVLAVVAGWRFTPPPRVLVAAAAPPLALHIHTGKAMFQVLVSPGRVGIDHFVLQLMDGEGTLLAAKEATLTLSLPERGIEPFERKAVLGADGYWSVRDVAIPFAGRWHLRIDALVTDFEKITLEDDLDVPER
ncbi:CopD family protein [Bradyrhizobium sp.]|uniref:copper resistance CopC/CopD family protein n=1 Tax=Bradyrhizobium sp. TaxID=376 RepID=UPI002732E1B4|nr:CopD family protein [Bradyrhizobium sp.]MDP3079129.1 CopD family protein [Bradyrhizobium sp.]